MPREDEWDPADEAEVQPTLDGAADEETGEPEEEEEELDPKLVARIEAKLRPQFEAEFQEHKKSVGKKIDAMTRSAREMGFDRTEDGRLVVADPARFRETAGQLFGNERQPQAEPEDADEEFPEDFSYLTPAQQQQHIDKLATRRAQQHLGPIQAQLNEMRELLLTQSTGAATVMNAAREFLADFDLEPVADLPEFKAIYQQALRSAGAGGATNPRAQGAAAALALAEIRAQYQEAGEPLPRSSRRQADASSARANANRGALNQTGSSRGSAGRNTEAPALTAEEDALRRTWGISADEWNALETDQTHQQYLRKKARR